MRKALAIVLVVIALVIGLGIAMGIAWFVVRRAAAPAPKIGNTATIIQQIQSLSELVTVKYVVHVVCIEAFGSERGHDHAGAAPECREPARV